MEDYNFGTLVRIDARGEYSSENTLLGKSERSIKENFSLRFLLVSVVRVQFYAIEIARNREGHNASIRDQFK